MPDPSMIMTLLAETSLHPGIGQALGAIDLPIQRERHTGFPMIQASSVKGSLRDAAEEYYIYHRDPPEPEIVNAIFGPPENPEYAGALQVFDARLLAFPVRSLQQVFVWVTCPLVLKRLRRDIALAGLTAKLLIPDIPVASGEVVIVGESGFTNPLGLEELLFHVVDRIPSELTSAFRNLVSLDLEPDWTKRLVVISDEDFSHLAEHSTPVSARVQLTPGKTTDKWATPLPDDDTEFPGNFWYEETLPPETLLYAILRGTKPKDGKGMVADKYAVLEKTKAIFKHDQGIGPFLQVGGNETVGQGWCRIKFFGEDS